jgi:hypothetical protein
MGRQTSSTPVHSLSCLGYFQPPLSHIGGDLRRRLLSTPTNPRAIYQAVGASRINQTPRREEIPDKSIPETPISPYHPSVPRVKYTLPDHFDRDPSCFRTFYTHCINYISLTAACYLYDHEQTEQFLPVLLVI